MTAKSRTIDNLGVEASIRYAKDQQLFEPQYLEESRLIPQKTETISTTPRTLTEFDQQYAVGGEKRVSWALFSAPPASPTAAKSLFSYQLIPSLGSQEKLESDTEKLKQIEDLLKKGPKKGRSATPKEKAEDEEAIRKLTALFQQLHSLDKILQLINGRRNQYQKG